MSRRLTANEIALWKRVAATVRPLPGSAVARAAPAAAPQSPLPPPPRPLPKPRAAPVPPPPPPARRPPPPVTSATLDGSWDQRLRRGQVIPDRVIDLHGYTLADAHGVLAMALDDAVADGARVLLVITGKGRGDRPSRIKAELADWLGGGAFRSRIAALRPAHPRHGGGGAHYLILRRTPPSHLG
ncbi:Smr/MutS family protein [Polymorphobacter fuscus]|uniref:DNA mismatch repair protein MutS n=1 Tax=Sandarakinorhabdus fusca TaxID=1439888 RepID=A0A7C9KYD2_9SPHN|nr:Smr/MutS family protein [Polymorphobacter fuscus]KAB7644384.1 DNA mismatch repair protein MutS [Polymorphobacter fuscus]MQT18302.1 DNA mismatch repair protein MutS [Polymorphobacter fuscus]NJC08198.1 DNA-nicking Smr family endonuclease [Polymorphobacter fuscus]